MPDSSPSRSCSHVCGVGADRHVGPAAGDAHRARGRRAWCSGPPTCAPDVAQAHVVGGVEARLGAEVAARQRAERLLDLVRERRHDAGRYPQGPRTRRPARYASRRSCATIRLYDTRPRSVAAARAARPREGRHLRLRADGLRARPRRQRAPVRRLLPAQALPRARGLRRDARRQRHRHQRQDLRRRARRPGAPSAELARGDDRRTTRATPSGSGSAGRTTSRSRRRRAGRSSTLIAGAGRRAATPTRRGGDVYFRVRSLRRLRRALAPRRRPDGPGRGRRGRRSQGGPARLRAVEGAEGGRGHLLGLALGPRAGRAGTSSARRWPRSCSASSSTSTAAAIDLVFPHHENEAAQTLAGARQAARADLDAQRDAPARRREDVQVGGQHPRAARGARRGRPATRWSCTSRGGHYRQPIAFSRRARSRTRARSAARIREAGRRLVPGPSPEDAGAAARRVLRRAGRRLQHRRGRWRRCTTGSARPTAARARSATRTCARCSTCSGWSQPARRPTSGPPAEAVAAGRSGATRRARRATGPRPTGSATSCARSAGRCATARTDRSSSARGPTRAAARGARPQAPARRSRAGATRAWPRASTARNRGRAEALRGPPQRVRAGRGRTAAQAGGDRELRGRAGGRRRGRRDRGPLRHRAHQGVCAEVDPYPYADAAELLAAPDPLLVALDEVTDPQNLGAVVPHGGGARGRPASSSPSAARPRSRPRSARRRRARSSTCRSPGSATSPTSSRRPRTAGCWIYGAAAERAHALRRPGLQRRGRRWCSGRRARGCARGSPRRATTWSSLPLRGTHRIAQRAAPTAAVLLYEILQQRLDTST